MSKIIFEREPHTNEIEESVSSGIVSEALWGLVSRCWDIDNCCLEEADAQALPGSNDAFLIRLPNGTRFKVTVEQFAD